MTNRTDPGRWEDDGACRDHDVALWFPERDTGVDNQGLQAKAICAQCPVVIRCLEAALDRNEEHGIWGGAGESKRRWLARQRRTGGDAWAHAVELHLADLRAAERTAGPVVNRNGPDATHGLRATYNRGCRCKPCRMAASWDVARQKLERAS